MVRKTTNQIDPVAVTAAVLKTVKCASDYHQIGNANGADIFIRAWEKVDTSEQQRITDLVANNEGPHPQLIADQLAACGNKIELMTLKSHYGEIAIRAAWKLLNSETRSRLTFNLPESINGGTATSDRDTRYLPSGATSAAS